MPPNPTGPDLASRAARDALAANLRSRRKALGLTVTALSERSEVSRQAIHGILSGGRHPSLDTVSRLAHALNTTAADLLTPPPPRLP